MGLLSRRPKAEFFTCPRRHDFLAFQGDKERADRWRSDGTCSYCGSIKPEEFMEAVWHGDQIGPTDKDYKAYVDLPECKPDELRVVSVVNYELSPERIEAEGWVKVGRRERRLLENEGWGRGHDHHTYIRLAPRGPTRHAKFYFQHLDDGQRKEFIELLNDGTMNVGPPGHFYRLPFFAKRMPLGGGG